MLKPKSMEKIFIYGTKDNSKAIIAELYSLGALHIIEHRKTEGLDIGTPHDTAALCSSALVQLRSIASFLKVNLNEGVKQIQGGLKSRVRIIEQIHSRVMAINSKKQINEGELRKLEQDRRTATIAKEFGISNKLLQGTKHLEMFLGQIKNNNGKNGLHEHLDKITKRYEMKKLEQHSTILVYVDKTKTEEVANLLSRYAFQPLNVRDLVSAVSTESFLKQLESAEKRLQKENQGLDKEAEGLKKEYSGFLVESERLFKEEIERAQAPLKFAETKYSFAVQGFIPTDRYDEVRRKLAAKFKGIYIQDIEIGHDESVPIKLQNPKISSPFEFLMRLYTLPNYKELDPTSIMFITFPMLFGFMVGDWGYGLLLLALFLVLRGKIKAGRQLFDIMIAASISTMIFGFIFGEFFGFEQLLGHHLPTLLVRSDTENINTILMISLIIGVIHINFGLLLGFINEFHHHGFWHAFIAKISWMILQAGALLILLKFNLAGGIIMALAAILLVIGEGVRGIIELPSIFGNILSYARLMALILAGVQMAVIINKFAVQFWSSGSIGGIIAGVCLLVFGHIINIALSVMGPFLHSLRLHYVEFFSKFYTGGGKEYRPFGTKE
jgi:V/A-type H+-transporting ATPase subunit I